MEKTIIKGLSSTTGVAKNNRPYKMFFIETPNGKASCYCDVERNKSQIAELETWKDGDEKVLNFEKNKEYLNFSIPSRIDLLEARVEKIERYLAQKAK